MSALPARAVGTTLLAEVAPRPAGGIATGCHRYDYWRSLVPAQLTWLAARLATSP